MNEFLEEMMQDATENEMLLERAVKWLQALVTHLQINQALTLEISKVANVVGHHYGSMYMAHLVESEVPWTVVEGEVLFGAPPTLSSRLHTMFRVLASNE